MNKNIIVSVLYIIVVLVIFYLQKQIIKKEKKSFRSSWGMHFFIGFQQFLYLVVILIDVQSFKDTLFFLRNRGKFEWIEISVLFLSILVCIIFSIIIFSKLNTKNKFLKTFSVKKTFEKKNLYWGVSFILILIFYRIVLFRYLEVDISLYPSYTLFSIFGLALVEEIFFRYFPLFKEAQYTIENDKKLWGRSVLLYSGFFMFWHLGYNYLSLINLFIFSVVLFFVIKKSKSIIFPVLIHVIDNFFIYSLK